VDIAVTGLGAICAAGDDVPALWEAVQSGRTGLRPVARFDVSAFSGPIAGEVPGDPATRLPAAAALGDRVVDLALVAAREAWSDACVDESGVPTDRIAVVVGTSSGSLVADEITEAEEQVDPLGVAALKSWAHHRRIAVAVADALGAEGPRFTLSSACTSGNVALALAADLLDTGQSDLVLIGGADGMSRRKYAGFDALGAIAPGACAPFSDPVGMNLGEGAAFLVLEHAGERGARERARWLGSGMSADAFHPTAPDPRGRGVARAIRAALEEAGVPNHAVGWYDAHATGTELNDQAEWRGVVRAVGDHADHLPASGPKSFFGHTFGAAGALEAVLAVLALEHQAIPPTLQFTRARPGAPSDPVADEGARPAAVEVVVSHNAAFGGHNATVVLGRAERHARQVPSPRLVAIRGASVVGAGSDPWAMLDAGASAAEEDEGFPVGRVDLDLRRELRTADPREFDRQGALLAVACARALADGGLRVRGALREGAGLFVGHSRRAPTSQGNFQKSYDRGRVSALAFSRTVMNAGAGAVSRALSLRGPQAVMAMGPGSGLFAIGWAAVRLANHPDADCLVAAGADELDRTRRSLDPELDAAPRTRGSSFLGEGASAVVLAPDGPVRVASVAFAGSFSQAVRGTGTRTVGLFVSASGGPLGRALEADALDDLHVGLHLPSPAEVFGFGESWTAAAALAQAARLVRLGRFDSALVVAGHPEIGACAIRLEGK